MTRGEEVVARAAKARATRTLVAVVAMIGTVVLGLTLLLGLVGLISPAARAAVPSAGAAASEPGFSVRTQESVEVGHRPTFELDASDDVGQGRLRIVVLSTFGKGKGLPKDSREWQTRVAYDGSPVTVDGPVLRVGDYRVRVWFTPAGAGADADAQEDGESAAETTFTVRVSDEQADAAGSTETAAQRDADEQRDGGSAVVGGILGVLALVAVVACAAVVLLRRRRPAVAAGPAAGRRRRTDVDADVDAGVDVDVDDKERTPEG